MTPDEMSDRLAAWERECTSAENSADCPGCMRTRRVVCVEAEGQRRTWVLHEGGRQVGLVRLRLWQGAEGQREWLYEASDRTRAMLGL